MQSIDGEGIVIVSEIVDGVPDWRKGATVTPCILFSSAGNELWAGDVMDCLRKARNRQSACYGGLTVRASDGVLLGYPWWEYKHLEKMTEDARKWCGAQEMAA